jgi:hypothetical protein
MELMKEGKHFGKENCGSDLLMRRLNLFLACRHLNSGPDLRECEAQSWLKVQAVPMCRFE